MRRLGTILTVVAAASCGDSITSGPIPLEPSLAVSSCVPGPPANPGRPQNPGPPPGVGCRPVATISVIPADPVVPVGLQLQMAADMRDNGGFPTEGRAPVWSSSNAAVAAIGQDGLLTAITEGVATVSAQVDGLVASTDVTVVTATVVRICAVVEGGEVPTYPNVADGVAAVAEGGVVRLCEGIHEVDVLALDKALTLEPEDGADATVLGSVTIGHGSGTIAIQGITFATPDRVISASGTYADVLLDGLTFLESSASFGSSTVPESRVVVRGSSFVGGTRSGLVFTGVDQAEVRDNYFEAQVALSSLQFQSGSNGIITGNRFEECGWRGCIRVVRAGTVLITNNTIRTTARTEVFEERFGRGVIAGLVADGANVTAEDNLVEGIGSPTDPSDPNAYPMAQFGALTAWYGIGSVTFRNNEVRNAGVGITGWTQSLTATGNRMEGVHTGLLLPVTLTSVDVHQNDFTGYEVSLQAFDDPILTGSATCNWWGNVAGPQNPLLAAVDVYTPFATSPIAGTGRDC